MNESFQTFEIFRDRVNEQLPAATAPIIRAEIKKRFYSLKTQMIAEFLNHLVTTEIKLGPDEGVPNISGTLGGYGNLFSFIGFDYGEDPIEPIVDALSSSEIIIDKITRTGIFFSLSIPTAEAIFAITPMPWASGRSWAKGIETGISGMGQYLSGYRPSSRSEFGVQVKHNRLRGGGRFHNTPYISRLINKYTQLFLNINI